MKTQGSEQLKNNPFTNLQLIPPTMSVIEDFS
jgi:hypothetical protein